MFKMVQMNDTVLSFSSVIVMYLILSVHVLSASTNTVGLPPTSNTPQLAIDTTDTNTDSNTTIRNTTDTKTLANTALATAGTTETNSTLPTNIATTMPPHINGTGDSSQNITDTTPVTTNETLTDTITTIIGTTLTVDTAENTTSVTSTTSNTTSSTSNTTSVTSATSNTTSVTSATSNTTSVTSNTNSVTSATSNTNSVISATSNTTLTTYHSTVPLPTSNTTLATASTPVTTQTFDTTLTTSDTLANTTPTAKTTITITPSTSNTATIITASNTTVAAQIYSTPVTTADTPVTATTSNITSIIATNTPVTSANTTHAATTTITDTLSTSNTTSTLRLPASSTTLTTTTTTAPPSNTAVITPTITPPPFNATLTTATITVAPLTSNTSLTTATTAVTTIMTSVINTSISQGNVSSTQTTATTEAKTTPQVTVTQENSTVQVITSTTAALSPTTASPYNWTRSVDELPLNVSFTIKFNENFSKELLDKNSPEFETNSRKYREQLTSAYNESAGFKQVFIVKFWQGSIGVDFEVQYNYGQATNVSRLTTDLTKVLENLGKLTGVDKSYVNTTTRDEVNTVKVQLNRIKDDPCSIPKVCRWSEQCTYNAEGKTVTCTHPCISLACGSGGQCVLNDAGQPQCRCKVEGDYVYAGETCGEKVEKLQLSSAQIIGVAAGVGGGLVLVLTLALLVMCFLRRKESKKQTWKGKDAVEPDYPSGDYKEDEPPLLMESFKRLSNTPESELPSSPLKNGGQGLKQSQRQEALPNIHGYTNRGYETSEDLLQNVRGESRSPGRQTGDYLMLEPEVNGLPHVYRTLEDGSYIYGGRSSLPRPTFTSPTRQSRKTRTEADGDPTTERSGFPSAEDGRWMPSPARFGSDGSPLENSMRKNMKRVDGSSLDRLSAVYNFSESHDLAGRQDDLDPYTSGANPSRGLRPETRQSARSQNYTYIDNQRY